MFYTLLPKKNIEKDTQQYKNTLPKTKNIDKSHKKKLGVNSLL